jgi:hypothetical protein
MSQGKRKNKMSRREQLIDLLVARSNASRGRLERESTDELEKALDRSLLAGIRAETMNSPEVVKRQQEIDEINADRQRMAQENQLSLIFRTPINGKVAIDNFANRNIIAGWLQEDQGESINATWFQKVLKENPSLARSLSWQSADILDPVKRKQAEANQEAADRETFSAFVRENGFSECESNHLLVKSVLGSGFNSYQLSDAVSSNALSLAQASPEELEKFRQEAAEERQDFLINRATPLELRRAARQESEQLAKTRQHAAQQVKIREEKERSVGYYPLPETTPDGQTIDRAFLLNLANTNINKYKQWCSYHGFAAITARLNGVR